MNDLILKSNKIFAADGSGVFSGAVVIQKGLITEVMHTKPAEGIDLGDRLIVPGFCDSHIHGFLGSLQMQSPNLIGCSSEADCVNLIKNAKTGDGWILGFGWNHFNWKQKILPDKRSLDAVFPDNPVCLFNEEMHSAWINSTALKICGINKKTPQPELGKIFYGDDGEPNGYLLEPEAMKPVFKSIMNLPSDEEEKLYQNLLNDAAGFGITSLSDIQIFDSLNCGIYAKMQAEDRLNCRIYPVFPMSDDTESLIEYQKKYDSDFLRFSGVKEFIDGTAPMYTGVLVEPYADKPGFNAKPLIDVEKTIKKAIELDRIGIRIRFHACGAGAVRLGLDIFEEVRKRNGFNDTRHTIEHIENIHPYDFPRFKQLGVSASVQPDHLWSESYDGHPFHSLLGEERCRWAWPFKSLLESGADMAFGTDFPVSPLNPMQGLYRAISRRHEDGLPEEGWNPREKLSIAESITLYTAGSSRQMYAERLTGMLKPGMAADIAVVDGDLFAMDADEIRGAEIYMTVSAGRIVYSKT